jgi:hypothetical protein
MKSNPLRGRTDIVIPITQNPIWFNKQNVGSSISMDTSPIIDDTNCIGIACYLTFVAHDDPTNLGEERSPHIGLVFRCKQHWRSTITPIHLENDLVTVDLEHMLLIFLPRESFMEYITSGQRGCFPQRIIKLEGYAVHPPRLHLEVKNCGYRWIFKEDVEQLNPQMMYGGNSSVQNKYSLRPLV